MSAQSRPLLGDGGEWIFNAIKRNPEGLLLLAAGAALAAAFPPTELEKETLGPVGDQMSKVAERFGDQLKQATSKAGEKLKTAAEERGLHTEGLKDVASEVVDTFKASMTAQAEQNDMGPAPRADNVDRSR